MNAYNNTNKNITLLEILDRIIDKGIVIKGDLVISIANVNLIYVDLQLIITSVGKMMAKVEKEIMESKI